MQLIELQAGLLNVCYQNGFLRYVRVGEHEVLRMIYFALRDHHWNTLALHIQNEFIEQDEHSFRITYECFHERNGQEIMRWECQIMGTAESEITFEVNGKALQSFLKNRVGICVLHPLKECMGKPCEITHVNNSIEKSTFPEWISPHQPFLDIQAMRWQLPNSQTTTLTFEGEVFEMEDQRNWTDASFKTYSTPLTLPFPVEMQIGNKVWHKATLSIEQASENQAINPKTSSLGVTSNAHSTPALGTMQSSVGRALTESEVALLSELSLSYYQTTVRLHHSDWQVLFTNAVEDSKRLGWPLDITLEFDENPETQLIAFVKVCQTLNVNVGWLMPVWAKSFRTDQALIESVVLMLRDYFPETKIGGGTELFFADLNRNRFPTQSLDFVSFTINPQIHAFDDLSLMENLEGQAHTICSAKHYFDDLPVRVIVSLRPRFSPSTMHEPTPTDRLPLAVDVRQRLPFCADWTQTSLQNLSEVGVSAITYYETVGWKGLMMGECESPQPALFPAQSGEIFPVFEVFKTTK